LSGGRIPPWASSFGQDRFGVFATFRVAEVEQRLRWIPGGLSVVGSPEDEPGRWDDEGRQEIALEGFWLDEVPCTQDLYEAVMGGSNPSRFRHPRRPVEGVSWNDAQVMIARLNAAVPGLDARLPFEAEWEYACRAGTTTATYAGPMEILGKNHAPVLDRIAWYGGNSGVGFDLEDGFDSSEWKDKQFFHERAGTRVVGLKRPNAWGLYDMLGNVWEWCLDVWGGTLRVPSFEEQREGMASDVLRQAAHEGALRVGRGGAWCGDARFCRAAFRVGFDPALRLGDLGFRLSRGQE
jgi:formylglycine-generating enzyme required for sulfatase activity